VSLPWQYLIVPLGGVFREFASMTLAPDIAFPPPLLELAPPPPLFLLLLTHATTNIASATTNAAANLLRATIERTLLLKPFVPRGSPPNE
jgi:hypothetical protein